MDDEKRPTIAENQSSPASDAAEEVDFGPSSVAEDDQREEPPGTAEAPAPKTDSEGNPVVPPSRGHH